VARVLIKIDMVKGLAESLEIEVGDGSHTQLLDFYGIPFQCVHCHLYGHVVEYCPWPFTRNIWHKKKIQHGVRL
jgi:hypothetical protein